MRRSLLLAIALSLPLDVPVLAEPFVAFPQAGQLLSPDGRFLVRNAEVDRPAAEFVGAFRSLWLMDVATGRARKLCDYWGTTMVGWSAGQFVIVTQYMSKKSSRTLLFSAPNPADAVVLDTPTLIRLLPPRLKDTLRDNDHVFIEGSRVEGTTLILGVWGYGRHDANGFRWKCAYGLREGSIACGESLPPEQSR